MCRKKWRKTIWGNQLARTWHEPGTCYSTLLQSTLFLADCPDDYYGQVLIRNFSYDAEKCSAKCKQLRLGQKGGPDAVANVNELGPNGDAPLSTLLTSTWAKCSGKWANLLASSSSSSLSQLLLQLHVSVRTEWREKSRNSISNINHAGRQMNTQSAVCHSRQVAPWPGCGTRRESKKGEKVLWIMSIKPQEQERFGPQGLRAVRTTDTSTCLWGGKCW